MGDKTPKERTILPFYALRLRDLVQPVAVLTVVCESRRHRAAADPFAFAAAKGPDTNLSQLAKVLRCEQCGMKGWV